MYLDIFWIVLENKMKCSSQRGAVVQKSRLPEFIFSSHLQILIFGFFCLYLTPGHEPGDSSLGLGPGLASWINGAGHTLPLLANLSLLSMGM